MDELRTGLARIAATVVPDEDPYDRLMRHARRRRRSRWACLGALLAALLTTAVVAPATGVGGLGNWLRDPEQGSGYRVTNDWVWRLINSPTRGSLAADGPLLDELTRVFDRNRDEAGMGSALPAVKVLFADDSSGVRQVVVAYHSDTSAALVAKTGELGARPQDLVRAGGISNLPILPFTMVGGGPDGKGQGSRWLLGLAPAGCTVWSAPSATLTAEGAVGRTWRRAATPGYLLLDEQRIRGWWRVECGGTIREEGPVGVRTGELSGRQSAPALDPRATSTGPLSPDDELRQVEQAAVSSYRLLAEAAGLPGTPVPVRRWSGRIPGAGVPASIAGPASGVGPAVLQLGTGHDALLALAAANDARRDDTGTLAASRADWGTGGDRRQQLRRPDRDPAAGPGRWARDPHRPTARGTGAGGSRPGDGDRVRRAARRGTGDERRRDPLPAPRRGGDPARAERGRQGAGRASAARARDGRADLQRAAGVDLVGSRLSGAFVGAVVDPATAPRAGRRAEMGGPAPSLG
ncbi:hypothetical protein DLE60_17960 [Micromonospora globispora]|nr:hypothetical protein DLE60_17960 [Micromonospora globispora]